MEVGNKTWGPCFNDSAVSSGILSPKHSRFVKHTRDSRGPYVRAKRHPAVDDTFQDLRTHHFPLILRALGFYTPQCHYALHVAVYHSRGNIL